MHSKLKNILILSIFFASVLIFVFFLGSIYLKYFKESDSNAKQMPNNGLDFTNFQIRIYNGTNVSGIARQMKNFLGNFDLKVESAQNFNIQVDKSKIIVSNNSKEFGEYIAKLIGLAEDSLELNDSLRNYCHIVLGKDYKLLKPFRN